MSLAIARRMKRARAFAALGRSPDVGWYRRAAYFNAARKVELLAGQGGPGAGVTGSDTP